MSRPYGPWMGLRQAKWDSGPKPAKKVKLLFFQILKNSTRFQLNKFPIFRFMNMKIPLFFLQGKSDRFKLFFFFFSKCKM